MSQRRARKNSNSDLPSSGQWDAEEDHLLSYFLGSDGHRSNSHGSLPSLAEGPEHESGSSAGRSRRDSFHYSRSQPPPPTPAMQFYYSHHGGTSSSSSKGATSPHLGSVRGAPPGTAVSTSSSSSSLSSMAAHLLSGGPVAHQMMTTTTTASTSSKKEGDISPIDLHNHASPISPAAMIGAGNENLMLPPPPRYPSHDSSSGMTAASYPQGSSERTQRSQPQQQHPMADPEQQQRHMAWLQQINSIAMSAQRQQHQQQHTMGGAVLAPMQPPPGGGMPGFPVAAAGQHHPGMVPMAVASSCGGVAPHLAPSTVFATAATAGMPQQMHPPPATPTSSSITTAAAGSTPGSSGESAERRARRLARNRESARASRLRKKTRLEFLGEKVNRLNTEIETERGRKLMEMEPSLLKVRSDMIAQLVRRLQQQQQQDTTMDEGTTPSTQDEEVKDLLMSLFQETSPDCAVRRAAVTFQYNSLKQLLLPKYQEFLLWLTLHPESFFVAGKEEQAKKTEGQPTKSSPGRLSSKQIGEEITNEYKSKQEGSESTKKDDDAKSDNQEADNLTCAALDAPRMWPLFCYELSVSVDQEEKLLQAQNRTRQMPSLPNARSQMAVATRMATSMKNGVLYQSHAAAFRSENSLLRILSPEQSVKYLEWFAANRDRCRAVLDRQQQRSKSSDATDGGKETSLSEICRRLEEMMRTPQDEE